jgi:hypothetical protein
MTINNNKANLRRKSCHKLTNDIGALTMMWGSDEERRPSVTTH